MSSQTSGTENDNTSRVSEYINVLIVGSDLVFAKQVQAYLLTLQNDNPDKGYRIFPGINKEKIIEYNEKFDFHTVLVEDEVLADTTPENYLSELKGLLKKNPKNEKSPVILVTSKVNNELIKKLVREGWGDVLIKPLDQSLFLQKMNLYHKGRPIMKDATLFSMDSEHEIDIAFMYHTKTISEYGMKIIANQPLAMGVVVTLHADFLGIEILAQVIEVTKVADDSYTVQMMFIGVTAAETQAVRKFIRHEYAEEKQAG